MKCSTSFIAEVPCCMDSLLVKGGFDADSAFKCWIGSPTIGTTVVDGTTDADGTLTIDLSQLPDSYFQSNEQLNLEIITGYACVITATICGETYDNIILHPKQGLHMDTFIIGDCCE